ncbi:hypothetical protein THRCLA_00533 [Thraustotheca clavata]|uniref:Uncharacterized protein n=1 Tax=Thraustotheca clavata TaxID=74557 RepID=A0A1W0AB19_9STRA|nr:hypothetical protein THRCLA_00533 [Thraustotheca clavata]
MLKCVVGKRSNQADILLCKPPTGLPTTAWEKEFSVLFDERKPVGLGFSSVQVKTPHGIYSCNVQNIVHEKIRSNHAYDHNEHCYLSCDLKRVICPGLVVRGINDIDVRDMSFDIVVAKVKTAKRPLLLTFADPNSPETTTLKDAEILPQDADIIDRLKQDIIDLREQLQESNRQRDEAIAQLEQFKKWNDSLLATNDQMDETTKALHEKISAEKNAFEEKQAEASALERDRAHAHNKLHELTLENASIAARAEALHARLEVAQKAKREADAKIAEMEKIRLEELQAMDKLRREIHNEQDETSELDKLLTTEENEVAIASTEEIAQMHRSLIEKLRQQRKEHALHKRELEIQLNEHSEHIEHAKNVIMELEKEKQLGRIQMEAKLSSPPPPASPPKYIDINYEKERESWLHEKEALQAQVDQLNAQLETEKAIEQSLNRTISTMAVAEQARTAKEQAQELILANFMTQLSTKGILIQKHGRIGSSHPRFLYGDSSGHWISWMRVEEAKKEGAFQRPTKKTTIELKHIVDILPGKQTHVFHRTSNTPANRCFSLICAKPCRTIDMETETPEQCQRLIQGFRLIRQAFLSRSGI